MSTAAVEANVPTRAPPANLSESHAKDLYAEHLRVPHVFRHGENDPKFENLGHPRLILRTEVRLMDLS